ncbi:MAG: hypothetical protein JWN76_3078 [Chitinophagaceae bacterium]|nr:hypothetical protein [Chitinophagaceae bacterium]
MSFVSYANNESITSLFPGTSLNVINYSRLSSCSAQVSGSHFYGIKYVQKGCERYVIDRKTYDVKEREFLLVNKGQSFTVDFKNEAIVHGFCIGLSEELLMDVSYAMCTDEDTLLEYPDNPIYAKNDFHETVYSSTDRLSRYLHQLLPNPFNLKDNLLDSYSFFSGIAAELVLSQKATKKQIAQLRGVKKSTKKELFDRVLLAKNYIDANFYKKIDIPEIAKQAALSEFHFYRSFKEVYGISPLKYIVNKRMEKSLELLRYEKLPIAHIAYEVGFSDIYSFSKSFKKHYNVSPSRFLFNRA